MFKVYVGKPFTSTMIFGPERSGRPYQMTNDRFSNILSTWVTREIKFFVFLSISKNYFITPIISSLNSNERHFFWSPEFSVCVIYQKERSDPLLHVKLWIFVGMNDDIYRSKDIYSCSQADKYMYKQFN